MGGVDFVDVGLEEVEMGALVVVVEDELFPVMEAQ